MNYSKFKLHYFLPSIFLYCFLCYSYNSAYAQSYLKGKTIDSSTGETLPGVSILVEEANTGISSDYDGNFELKLNPGKYTIKASYLSYKTLELPDIELQNGEVKNIELHMEELSHEFSEVVIVAIGKLNSEMSMLNTMRNSMSVVSGVSAQQISKSQDRDASEVIKRIPGISIIDNKFVIARGLAQRYNNIWINGSATPSTESDTRSFSFDILPSSQIENIMIIKSPLPELPADFSGGFIKVSTKSVPNENSIQLSYSTGINTLTQFHDFKYNSGSSTDFLGFDNGKRELAGFVPDRVDNNDADQVTNVTRNGFNNDWTVKNKKPLPDQRFSFVVNRKHLTASNKIIGLIAALNYSNTYKTYTDMENSRFGVYNKVEDKPVFLYKYSDNQYNAESRIGAMANLVFIPGDKHKLEFRNMFNQLGRDRYTEREGFRDVSGKVNQQQAEYIYNSRSTYAGQLAGTHTFSSINNLDWTLGFSYANKYQPDRRIISQTENDMVTDKYYGQMMIDQNEISRDFSTLNEYAYSFAANYKHDFSFTNEFSPSIHTGVYAENKDRDYKNRIFYYRWIADNMPEDFGYQDVVGGILSDNNYGADKLYIYESTDNRDSYSGNNTLLAAYAAFNIPLNNLNIYGGLRLEHSKMSLKSYTSIANYNTKTTDYEYTDLFPSVNATYTINDENLIRAAYGRSVNRQEFREVSTSTYYDFDLFSSIIGNANLVPSYVNNFDVRYEFYPSPGEMISFALFYKHFKNPIEWTYIDAGGSYVYTFENARSADNYGLEVDIKKSLDFIGLQNFSLSFNGSLIESKVKFGENSSEHDRPMQGQSPYLVNAGLFYQLDKCGVDASLLYNIIGKRIVGIGKVNSSSGASINNDIPDMYEMPRNSIDFMVNKRIGKSVELSAGIKDILAEKVVYKQFPKYEDESGKLNEREQVTKEFRPGQTFSIAAKFKF